jgi:acetoin utilization deacetylase AcuC-like enzyme
MHFSHPDTKRRAHELIEVSGLIKHLQRIPGRPATREEITSVHTEEYHDRIKALSEDQGGHAGDGSESLARSVPVGLGPPKSPPLARTATLYAATSRLCALMFILADRSHGHRHRSRDD